MTHTGITEGCDARTPDNYRIRKQFRETKIYWIGIYGHRYSKRTGYRMGNWPIDKLDLASIKLISI